MRARVAAVLAPLLRKTRLKQSELERQLLIAGEAPGLILNATFVAGTEVGGSVLALSGRYRPVSASIYLDNAMPAAFGTGQVVTLIAENGLAGLGEQLLVSVAGDPEHDFFTNYPNRRYLSAIYGMPLGIDGWKLELFATDGRTTPYGPPAAATYGVFDQAHVKFVYEAIKKRDVELAFNAMFEPTDESLESIAFAPPVLINLDRVRPLRAGFDGIWRARTVGLTSVMAQRYRKGSTPSALAPRRKRRKVRYRCRSKAPTLPSPRSPATSRSIKRFPPTFLPPSRPTARTRPAPAGVVGTI